VATHFSRLLRHAWVTLNISNSVRMFYNAPLLTESQVVLKFINKLPFFFFFPVSDDWRISEQLLIYKGKVVPVLNQTPHHGDVLGEWRYSSSYSLASALDGGEWSASCPGRFTTRERAPGTHWIGGCMTLIVVIFEPKMVPNNHLESNTWDDNTRSMYMWTDDQWGGGGLESLSVLRVTAFLGRSNNSAGAGRLPTTEDHLVISKQYLFS
jgi:hypothetical protein